MNKIILKLFLAFSCAMGLTVADYSFGQTCRVRVGQPVSNVQSYLEVFEYDYVNEKPSFPGGEAELIAFINQTREYPSESYKRGIQGRVTCAFVINTDGSVSHISILKGVDAALNKEAVRVLGKMPCWKPGKHDGHVVPVRVIRSVPFRK